jgi:hypothetical protein
MMEDNKVAKLLISAIIREHIEELEFSFQPFTSDHKGDLTVIHFDFAAKITTPEGYKTVAIELQKAKLPSDIMRFRRYLGRQYQNPGNTSDKAQLKARQIYCIYFMNYDLGISDSPVLEVNHNVKDATTGEEFSTRNEFIESTQHRSWIIQIQHLKNRRRTDLELLLSVFDQSKRMDDGHILDVREDELPEQYRPLFRRLIKAGATPEIRNQMDIEDTYIEDYLTQIRLLAESQKTIEEQGKALEEQGKTLEEQGKAIEEKDKAIEALKKQLEEMKRNNTHTNL